MPHPSEEKPGERKELTGNPTGRFSSFQNQIYGTFSATPYPLGYERLRAAAKEKLPEPNFNYVDGSASSETTARDNLKAFDDWYIIPSMLKDANKRSLEVDLFGEKHNCPVLLAPVGVQGIVHPDAEVATAKAAEQVGIGMVFSTAATRSMEKVAEANGNGLRWYQLYWPITDEITLSLLERARSAGYTALVVTLDTFSLGYRPKDLENSYLPFLHGQGLQNLFSDPVFMKKYGQDHTSSQWNGPGEEPVGVETLVKDPEKRKQLVQLSMAALGETNSGHYFTWKDVAFLRKNWKGPLILKGIQSVEDAESAIDAQVDGIVVSNHGGRQVNGAMPSLLALERITSSQKVKDSNLTVLFDSGIRTGADIVKALALGAKAVLLGRPYMWGLALGGQEGVEHVTKGILADLELTMALSGRSRVADLDRSILLPADRRDREAANKGRP